MAGPLNHTVLMSGADYFNDSFAINAYMDNRVPVDQKMAMAEHASIKTALEQAGITVVGVPPPKDCQDGVYTANWGLCRNNTVILSRLPNKRQAEEAYAEKTFRDLGKKIVKVPENIRFSGQGDALPCGNLLFMGTNYRTDIEAHQFVADTLGYEVISLQTIPKRRYFGFGPAVINLVSGWPDSFFYDIDLALTVLRTPSKDSKGLIAWCPHAFTPESRAKIRQLSIDKIEVSKHEAQKSYACNLISTGSTVIMTSHAPILRSSIEAHGFEVITPEIRELAKGGGFIRCTTLTLDNQ